MDRVAREHTSAMVVLIAPKEKGIEELPKLLDQIGISLGRIHLALVKTNLCGYYPPSPKLVRAAVHYLEDIYKRRFFLRFGRIGSPAIRSPLGTSWP